MDQRPALGVQEGPTLTGADRGPGSDPLIGGLNLFSDCLYDQLDKSIFSGKQLRAAFQQTSRDSCVIVKILGGSRNALWFYACEVDPGNSARNNNAQSNADKPQSDAAGN